MNNRKLKIQSLLATRRLFIVAATVLLSFVSSSGTAVGQGTISGTILDAQTSETLIGVNVIVVGTTAGAATGIDGRYSIPGLEAGSYSVKVSYLGFETKLFTDIKVTDGGTTRLDVDLAEAVLSSDDEIVIIGERPLMDVEQAASTSAITRAQLEIAPLRGVEEAVATQVGVVRDPTGLYIRGGRAEETGFIVDGVSAKDPLAGTGFGLDIGSNSFQEVEVTTGGVGAEHGDVTSGVVSVTTQDGDDTFRSFFGHKRDNLGLTQIPIRTLAKTYTS